MGKKENGFRWVLKAYGRCVLEACPRQHLENSRKVLGKDGRASELTPVPALPHELLFTLTSSNAELHSKSLYRGHTKMRFLADLEQELH